MKIYNLPKEVPAPVVDYANYNRDKVLRDEKAHVAALKTWLLKNGFTGKLTGELYQEPAGDGYAIYMLADGRKSGLIHLPYGDAWHARDIQYVPKTEIIRRIKERKKLEALWDKKRKEREVANG